MKKIIFLLIAFFALSTFGQEDSVSVIYQDTIIDIAGDTSTITIEDEKITEEEVISEDTQTEDEDYIESDDFVAESTLVSEDTIISGNSITIKRTYAEEEPKTRKSRKQQRREIRCEERMHVGIEAFKRGRLGRAVGNLSLVRNNCSADLDNMDSVYFFLGLSYMKGKKYEDARLEFRNLIEEYPHSEFIEQTYYLIAYGSFRAAPIIQRDNRLLRRAEREFASFISGYPNSEWTDSARIYLDSITGKLIEKEVWVAEFYEIIRRWDAAVIYYQVILEDFVGNPRIPEIRLRLARNLIRGQRFAEAEDQFAILESQNLYKSEIDNLRKSKDRRDKRNRIR